MKFKVGDICEVLNRKSCVNFDDCEDAKYVKITSTNNYSYRYEFLDKNMKDISNCFGCFNDNDLRIYKKQTKEAPMKKYKFGVKYDRQVDPIELFTTRKKAERRIEELIKDSEVSSISLFEVGKIWNVTVPVAYKLVNVK